MADTALQAFEQALPITIFVFAMMLLVDYVSVLTRGRLAFVVRGGRLRQYVGASLLGATPGCLGAFLSVSLYMRGLLSFGGIVACMVATSGDEAFVMLALFPRKALLLFGVLSVAGGLFGWLTDRIAGKLGILRSPRCPESAFHEEQQDCRCFDREVWRRPWTPGALRMLLALLLFALLGVVAVGWIGDEPWIRIALCVLLPIAAGIVLTVPKHYLREHILKHLVRAHVARIFLWTFGTLFVLGLAMGSWDLAAFVRGHMPILLLIAAVLGLIPTSGPHLVFVTLFSQGVVPFSVLLVSSIVQDGHGVLPLLSHSPRDVLLIKGFNFVLGLALGAVLYVARI